MTAYYNEIDPFAAAWLRTLIAEGHIAPGDVDERDIRDVLPSDLARYDQCHWFAGIGVWSYALRLAGWPDDKPVWTGSCPCQPFSEAGQGAGFTDERHLWPYWHWLIAQQRPAILFGEQVAGKNAQPWIDLVHTDMEALDYAFGTVPFPAASIGAPHIRDRLYWVADTTSQRQYGRRPDVASNGFDSSWSEPERLRHVGGLAYPSGTGLEGRDYRSVGVKRSTPERSGALSGLAHAQYCGLAIRQSEWPGSGTAMPPSLVNGMEYAPGDGRQQWRPESGRGSLERRCAPIGMEYASSIGRERRQTSASGHFHDGKAPQGAQGEHGISQSSAHRFFGYDASPVNGFWADADWLLCRDGKWRPVEPGTFPLAHGAPARVGRLRGYGNAINAQAAYHFIKSYMEVGMPGFLQFPS